MLTQVATTKVEKLAYRLMWSVYKLEHAQRPVDRKVAQAELSGMCKAASALGFGHTDTHVEMMVRDVYRMVPAFVYSPTNARSRVEWESATVRELSRQLISQRSA